MPHKTSSPISKTIHLLLCTILLVGCGLEKGEVTGTLVDRDGDPLMEAVTVILEPLATFEDGSVGWSLEYELSDEYPKLRQEVVTIDGTFHFEDVEPGPYRIGIQIPGDPVINSHAIIVTPGESFDFGELNIE